MSPAISPPGGIAVGSARGRWVLVAAVLGSGMAGIDSSVMNVALPVIGRDLGADFSQLQWTVTGYTLSLAALILLSGALGDHFGRRRVFVYGAFGAFSFVFTAALETISGYSPVKAGSTLVPITIIALLLSGRSGQLAGRIGPRLQVTVGPFLCAAAAMLAVRVSAHTGYWTTVIPLECVFGLGIAAMVAPLTSAALSSVPAGHAGVASGVTNAVSRAAALLWIAALPPIAGLSGPAYANAATLRGGYQEICVVCAASLALAGTLAAFTLKHRRRHSPADIVPPRLPHPAAPP